jgi:very-short-patch-repair endonuclease
MRARRHRHSHHRTQQLEGRASTMRWAPTASESTLWQALKSRQLGVQFRRQVVVGEYIVDFLAAEVRLAVEVDGGWHRGRERVDARRQRALEAAGYRVLRFEAEAVLKQLPLVVAAIRAAVGEG